MLQVFMLPCQTGVVGAQPGQLLPARLRDVPYYSILLSDETGGSCVISRMKHTCLYRCIFVRTHGPMDDTGQWSCLLREWAKHKKVIGNK